MKSVEEVGAAGTIFIEKRTGNVFDRELRVGSTDTSKAPSPSASARTFVHLSNISDSTFSLDRLLIDGSARAVVTQVPGFVLKNMYITEDAALDHSGLGQVADTGYDAAIAKNAGILIGGSGGGGAGFGAGGNGGYGYGGYGGVGEVTNGDVQIAPVKLGGAGGIGGYNGSIIFPGASGGGAIKIAVTDFMKVEGSIRSDGFHSAPTGAAFCGGAGGGGAIWISANRFELGPSHEFSARGGDGNCGGTYKGGGGGGGSIYVEPEVTEDIPSEAMCFVDGGYGYSAGVAGSALIANGTNSPSICYDPANR